MICQTKNRVLIIGNKKYRLSKLEYKFLVSLSTEYCESKETISKYVYGYCDKSSLDTIWQLKSRLLKKIKELNISTISCQGYRLETEIRWG